MGEEMEGKTKKLKLLTIHIYSILSQKNTKIQHRLPQNFLQIWQGLSDFNSDIVYMITI